MAKEIERKFLVTNNTWKKLVQGKQKIVQGYLLKSREATIRIRVSPNAGWLTIKGERIGIQCDEFEYVIAPKEAKAMLKMCTGPVVEKTRHFVADEHSKRLWEVDVFEGINKGFVLAEMEVPSTKTKIVLPDWIGREVSHDKRYTNAYLSTHKAPTE